MTKPLEDHFNSDMFQWHIYHHHQGESYTETWDTASPSCYAHIARVLSPLCYRHKFASSNSV
jgi:hypothetical protein